MQRVMIVGGPGSGKSTLARALGARTGLPVHHMDHIHWMPGWVERDRDAKSRLCAEVHRQERWIFEGGHSATWPERVARADTLIWLDMPVVVRHWRVIRRTLRYRGTTRPDLPDGCVERLDAGTLDFWRFIWTSRRPVRARIGAIFAAPPPHLSLYRLTSLRAVRRFLASVPAQAGPNGSGPPVKTAARAPTAAGSPVVR